MFWPGSETPIAGMLPNYWTTFDDEMPNVDRVNHALDLLALPEGERPSLLTVYFSEVDHVGHDYGPDSPEMAEALRHVDASLGLLETGVDQLHLSDRTAFVVVSDHGMAPLSDARVIFLDDYLDLSRVVVEEWGEVVQLRPKVVQTFRSARESVDAIYRAIKGRHPSMTVYKRGEIPARFHYRDNTRIQPVLALAAEGWEITSHARWQADLERHRKRGGAHGYDPRLQSMRGIFVAAGPHLKRGLVAPEFQNIHPLAYGLGQNSEKLPRTLRETFTLYVPPGEWDQPLHVRLAVAQGGKLLPSGTGSTPWVDLGELEERPRCQHPS